MMFIGEFMVIENKGEVEVGDVIKKAEVAEIPDNFPAILRKGNYYGRTCWFNAFPGNNTKKVINEKVKEMEDRLAEMKKISALFN